jgi:predicted  nucleic acid-binding Zn-ribbon protein
MSPIISVLLDLRTIDLERRKLRQVREEKRGHLAKAEQAAALAATAAAAAKAEHDRHQALLRQYQGDIARCEAEIARLRAEQPNAKTNREYMAVINGIEHAKSERVQREASVKDITARMAALAEKSGTLQRKSDELAARVAQIRTAAAEAEKPSPEEQALTERYDARKVDCPAEFLEAYERLAKANHPNPLCRVDPTTRATPYGQILSHHQVESIRLGKLVIDRGSNAILYLG